NFCSQCGTKLLASWNVCPNCGNSLKSERTYQNQLQTQPPAQIYYQQKLPPQLIDFHPRNNNTNGIIALIFGVLGLFNVVPIVGSILGIVFGAIGRKKDDDGRLALAGFIIGIIGLVIWIFFYLFLFISIFRAFYCSPYMD
ncbi:MAG: zinc-ribbon domain-containing protein, partial [Candidatus Thorarchaeota archaeon]